MALNGTYWRQMTRTDNQFYVKSNFSAGVSISFSITFTILLFNFKAIIGDNTEIYDIINHYKKNYFPPSDYF